jgi:hypothetical protein
MKALVIGATGVAGSSAIQALRQHFGDTVNITGLWYASKEKTVDIEGVDSALFGDIANPECVQNIIADSGSDYDWCFFATALGDVGFPIDEANQEQIDSANRLSFDPLLSLESQLNIGTLVAYSTFYSLDHQKITYGAMGHSKHAIEQWAAVDTGRSRHLCIRAGAFRSSSSQGIKLLVRRRAKQLAESSNPLLRGFFAGEKPSVAVENMERAVFDEEKTVYGDTHTDISGLTAAHLEGFEYPDSVFVNVCGERVWRSETPQEL